MTTYCNQLGMLVNFSYCLSMNEGLPCRNIVGCWENRINIIAFLRQTYAVEQLEKIFKGLPKTRIQRIFESLKKESSE